MLSSIALKDAVSISVDPSDITPSDTIATPASEQAFSAPAQLKQSYAIVPAKQRLVTLTALLTQSFKTAAATKKCIVFMSCADSVDFHFELLTSVSATDARTTAFTTATPTKIFRLHGSLQQATRTSTLRAFSSCTDPAVLICTDVVSRGIDLPNIDLVIEYDPPFSAEDHLHRIGRTARAGQAGRAVIFLLPGAEEGYIPVLTAAQPHITAQTSEEILKKGFAPSRGVVGANDWEGKATEFQLEVERFLLEHPRVLEQARRAFQSHIRAYATHAAAERKIFDLKVLHLGHLAKGFGLRDKPGKVGVPGMRPGVEGGKGGKRKFKDGKTGASGGANQSVLGNREEGEGEVDEAVARRVMSAKVAALARSGASEFNLG